MFTRGIQYKNVDILQSFTSTIYKTKLYRIIEKSRCMSTSQKSDVLFEEVNNKGIITLNRPKKLNSLNFNIINSVLHKLLEWENKVEMVVIQGKGRAFCAGGDAVSVTNPGFQNPESGKDYFSKGYTLDGIIGEYRVPYVALIDGITMGGGVGLSIHGAIRIATENTIFAMPETEIGLFPDVGVSHFLSKMPHELGQFLALTGYRLKSTDVVKAGIATHYTRSENITNVLKDLIELKDPKINLPNYLSSKTDDLKNIEFSLAPHLKLIETCFSAPTVEEIFKRLNKNGSDFAKHTLELLKRMSPISLKISNKLLKIDKHKTLQECLIIDYRLVVAALEARVSTDFYEGVRALLVDKDLNPRWSPPTLEDVTDDMVDTAFKELPSDEELNFEKRVSELRKRLNVKL